MDSLTYKDIIDDKIADWQNSLKKFEEQAGMATSDTKVKLIAKKEQFKSAIDTAILQLRKLDEHETVANTMETKDKILEIFGSIDRDFKAYDDKTPFML